MSSKRYSSDFSPNPAERPVTEATELDNSQFRHREVARPNTAAKLLYVPAFIMLVAALRETGTNASASVLELGSFVCLGLGAWLLNEGIKAEAEYNARKIARRPAIPRKAFAAALAGLGVVAGYYSGSGSLIASIVFGAIASTAHVIGFGLDPMRNKGLEGVSDFDTDRVARAVEKAEDLLRATTDAAKRIGDRTLEARVEKLANSVRSVFRAVEEDPRDLARARKFMTVYLMGARDATAKFADIYRQRRDPEARAKYESLLDDLEASFTEHRETLLLDNRSDLDVEIEVLRERLATEGLLRTE